jgi:hypothetical protein
VGRHHQQYVGPHGRADNGQAKDDKMTFMYPEDRRRLEEAQASLKDRLRENRGAVSGEMNGPGYDEAIQDSIDHIQRQLGGHGYDPHAEADRAWMNEGAPDEGFDAWGRPFRGAPTESQLNGPPSHTKNEYEMDVYGPGRLGMYQRQPIPEHLAAHRQIDDLQAHRERWHTRNGGNAQVDAPSMGVGRAADVMQRRIGEGRDPHTGVRDATEIEWSTALGRWSNDTRWRAEVEATPSRIPTPSRPVAVSSTKQQTKAVKPYEPYNSADRFSHIELDGTPEPTSVIKPMPERPRRSIPTVTDVARPKPTMPTMPPTDSAAARFSLLDLD